MRTTLTLDDDVAAAIEAERSRTGETFRQVLNRLVRRGLGRGQGAAALPLPLLRGLPRHDIRDVSAALADLDDERSAERGGP